MIEVKVNEANVNMSMGGSIITLAAEVGVMLEAIFEAASQENPFMEQAVLLSIKKVLMDHSNVEEAN